jgi:hypothetical protein
MKTMVFTLILSLVVLSLQDILAQNYTDSLNSLEIVLAKPNKNFLQISSNIYIPDKSESLTDLGALKVTENLLSERYGCDIHFLDEFWIDEMNDPLFEVTPSDWESFGILHLHLSVLEDFHQRGILINQVKNYGRFTDKIFYSQIIEEPTKNDSLISFTNYADVSELLFGPCNGVIESCIYDYFIPLSSDSSAIEVFSCRIYDIYTTEKYQCYVLSYNKTDTFLSDVWVEVGDGSDSIVLPLCALERARQKGKLERELNKVFAVKF